MTAETGREAIAEDDIVRFLQTRPDFLARHPALYLTLAPPARVHGEQVADHMAAMLGAARQQNRQLEEGVRRKRASRSFAERVEQALIGLIRAADPFEWLNEELAATLGLDAAHLCLEADGGETAGRPGLLPIGSSVVRRLLGGRDTVFRDVVTDRAALHGAAAALVRRDVLVRLRPGFGPTGLLSLGARDEVPGPGAEAPLALLAAGLQAALERR